MGGQTCTVCVHEAKEAIDQALVAGGSRRTIANQYGVSDAAVGRHRQNHLPATLVKAAEAQESARGGRLLDRVDGLVEKALSVLKDAENTKDGRLALGAIREARNCLELVGRASGELRESNRDNAQMTSINYILLVGKMFNEDELRRMIAGDATGEEQERFKTAFQDNAALRTVDGDSRVVDPQ